MRFRIRGLAERAADDTAWGKWVAVTIFVVLAAGCRERPAPAAAAAWFDRQDVLWVGIPCRVRFALPEARQADGPALLDAAWEAMRRTGASQNAFDPGSETGRLNREGATRPFAPSEDLRLLLDLCDRTWKATDGAFDPTVWPLKDLWKRARKEGVPPAPDDVKAARSRVGWARIARGPGGEVLPSTPPAAFDFGGIVKGFAVDRAVEVLRAAGVTDGLVQSGGEVRALGRSPGGTPWRVGVQDPLQPGGLRGAVEVEGDVALSTSGNYEQPIRIGGREWYHILDPRTGEPADTSVLGVTVVLEGGDFPNARADALATALAVLGPDRGPAVADGLPGVGALFLLRGPAGGVVSRATPRMAARLTGGPAPAPAPAPLPADARGP